MDLAASRRKYGHVRVDHRDWPVDREGFQWFAAKGSEPVGSATLAWNREGAVLLLRHRPETGWGDLWATPGGFAEPGESPEVCAVRETLEETGLVVKITSLTKIVVCYVVNEQRSLQYTFFQYEGEAQGEPRPGEGIAEVAWLDRLPPEMHFRSDYVETWMRGRPRL